MEPNQEIITSLKNAIEHGDSLENAIQIMINSGYNPQEVQEASKYIPGVTPKLQPKPEEQLTMPGKPRKEKKSFFSKLNIFKKKSEPTQQKLIQPQTPSQQIQQQPTRQISMQPQPLQQTRPQSPIQPILQKSQQNQPLAKQLSQIKPKKHSYLKEIILLTILIILIGALIATIIYRDEILRFFSG